MQPETPKLSATHNEEYWIQGVTESLKRSLAKKYSVKDTRRFFHPKMHGSLLAEFKVEENLPENLRVGVFAEEKSYPCWIRFSNARPVITSDQKQTTRGMAIKLMNVKGEKVMNTHTADTHDFICVNKPIFEFPNLSSVAKGIIAMNKGWFHILLFFITHPRCVLRSLEKIACANLLEAQYYSLTPSQFGTPDSVVKYSFIPHNNKVTKFPNHLSYDMLREQLENDLMTHEAGFDFCVQFQEDKIKQPIENPTVKWETPFVKLATIKIHKQLFSEHDHRVFGDQLSFNPWHCIEAHKPIGGINHARRVVYETMSKFRHMRDQMPMFEPTPDSFHPKLL